MSLMTTFTIGDTQLEVRSGGAKEPVRMSLRELAARPGLTACMFLDILETLASGAVWRGVMREGEFLVIRAVERHWP